MTSRDHLMGWPGLAPIMRAIEELGHPRRKPYPLGIPERVWQRGREQVAAQHSLARPIIPTLHGITRKDRQGLKADPITARALQIWENRR